MLPNEGNSPPSTMDHEHIQFGSVETEQERPAHIISEPANEAPTREEPAREFEPPRVEPPPERDIIHEVPRPVEAVRRSTRSGAQKPPGFYSKMNTGESVSDYTACHLRANDCSRLYGEEVTKKAGTTEVVNMIKDRGAAIPQDYRKLSPREIAEAVSFFMFFKAKDLCLASSLANPRTSRVETTMLQVGAL